MLVMLAACGRIGFDNLDTGTSGSTDAAGSSSGSDDAAVGTFGTTQVGISSQNSGADRVWISKFTLAEPAQVHAIVAHMGPSGSMASLVRGIVYADAAGTPTTLLGRTDEVALSGTDMPDWVTLPFASPVALAPGTYWLGTHCQTQTRIEYQSATGLTTFVNDVYSDGTDATYAGAGPFTMQLSVYAAYTR